MKPESVPISASDNAKQPDTSSDDTASQPVVPSKNGGEGINTGSVESDGLSRTDQQETGAPDPTVEPVENDEETTLSKDTINQFVQESDDLITPLEQALLVIDDMREGDTESIEEGFRVIHSFKGN